MKCTFFGHRNAPFFLKNELIKCIENLIKENDVKVFYVGTQGVFDSLVWESLNELKRIYSNILCYKVLAYLPIKEKCDSENTIYPEGLENVPKRLVIIKRNEWMIERSDIVITYIRHSGGAETFSALAKRKGKRVIEL